VVISAMSRRPLSWHTGSVFSGGGGLDSPHSGGLVAEGFPAFDLDASDVSRGAVEVIAKSPSGNTFPMEVIDSDGVLSTNFMPTEIGRLNLQSAFYRRLISNCRFLGFKFFFKMLRRPY